MLAGFLFLIAGLVIVMAVLAFTAVEGWEDEERGFMFGRHPDDPPE